MSALNDEVDSDMLFAGATRPAMIWGVTFEFFALNAMVSSVAFVISHNLLYLLIAVPFHGFFYLICLKEPRQLSLFFTAMKTRAKAQKNRVFWGHRSTYTPH